MTQMGLDYAKHLETKRNNLVMEDVQRRNATTNERNATTNEKDATTRAYTASFEPRKVAATETQAAAATSQANTAAKRETREAKYAERDMKAKELQAQARQLKSISDAIKVMPERNRLQLMNRVFEDLGLPTNNMPTSPDEWTQYFMGLIGDVVNVIDAVTDYM